MATSFRCLLLLLLSLLQVVHPTMIVATAAAAMANPQKNSDLVAAVCRNVPNHAFCIEALESDTRTATADLPGLAFIAIDLLRWNVSSIRNYIMFLQIIEKCPEKQQYLSICIVYYIDIQGLFGSCYEYLKKKQYDKMNAAANAVISNAFDCEATFLRDGCYSSPLTIRNNFAANLGDIIVSVANLLGNP
ncbi:pectinesterase inhibitor-like [Aristolochia californica]|uniref:pectinesterase inhibitor-like n=1 Tax=Aristolochia californica TaxID=171875 RepID=UPI0035DF1A53